MMDCIEQRSPYGIFIVKITTNNGCVFWKILWELTSSDRNNSDGDQTGIPKFSLGTSLTASSFFF